MSAWPWAGVSPCAFRAAEEPKSGSTRGGAKGLGPAGPLPLETFVVGTPIVLRQRAIAHSMRL